MDSRSVTYDTFGALTPEELGAWADAQNFSDGWERTQRVKTSKGAYVVRVEPVRLDGQPLLFGNPEVAE